MVDHFVVDHRQAERFAQAARHVLPQRAHLAGDRDDRHMPSPAIVHTSVRLPAQLRIPPMLLARTAATLAAALAAAAAAQAQPAPGVAASSIVFGQSAPLSGANA